MSLPAYVARNARPQDILSVHPAIARLCRQSSSPDQRWLDIVVAGVLPGSINEMLDGFDRLGVLRPTDGRLDLQAIKCRLRTLAHVGRASLGKVRAMCGVGEADEAASTSLDGALVIPQHDQLAAPEAYDQAVEEHISETADELARLAGAAPLVVTLALAGQLATAASVIPPVSQLTQHGFWSRAAVVDVLEQLGRFHIIDSLVQAADEANERFFSPTGLYELDENGDKQTTKGAVLKVMAREAETLLAVAKLYKQAGGISGHKVTEGLRKDTAADLAMLEAAITASGQSFSNSPVAVRRQYKKLAKFAGTSLQGIRLAQQDVAFCREPLWRDRGPHPIQMLWLNCAHVAAWLEPVNIMDDGDEDEEPGPKTKQHEKLTDDQRDERDLNTRSRLRSALDAAMNGTAPIGAAMPSRRESGFANHLHFLLRHVVVQDPNSTVVKASRKGTADLIATAFSFYNRESRKNPKQDPCAEKQSADARASLKRAEATGGVNALAFVMEAQGVISWRLQL